MDSKIIFVRTLKGEDEIRSKTAHLSGDIKRALLMVDGAAMLGEISKRAAPSLRNSLDSLVSELQSGGFIQDKARLGNIPKMVVPSKVSSALKNPMNDGPSELDFTAAFRAPSAQDMVDEAAKAEKLKAETEAHTLAEAKARAEAEAKAKQEIEAVRKKAEQEAARVRAELEAAKAEAAKLKAESEAKAKKLAEAARIEAEAKARIEAEAKARQVIEAAKLKAQQEVAAARQKADQEAASAREEAEIERQKAAAAAKAHEEAEHRAKVEAEAVRLKAAQEAAQARAELDALKAKTEAEAKAREETERRVREAEAASLKARQELESARLKAEQDAAKAREEAELAKQQAAAEAKAREDAQRHAREAAEAARVSATQEAENARAELEAVKAKAEAEAKAREETERRTREAVEAAGLKARQEQESARLKAEQDAAKAREEADDAASLMAQQEVEASLLKSAQDDIQASLQGKTNKLKSGVGAATRSTIATVLFFDVVGYTKQPVKKQIEIKKQFNDLVSDSLSVQSDGDRIILDTGDGAAIGFLQHPEDALEVAMQFRKTVMANQHKDYPDLKVRIGIHLGPINVAKDMNDRSNMVGDGINDAQRVMSFAGIDQIYISRSYYEFISRLSDEYANLFKYHGALKDKHGREHPVYELVDAPPPVAEVILPQASEAAPAIKLEPFSFALPEAVTRAVPEAEYQEPEPVQEDAGLLGDIAKFMSSEDVVKPVAVEKPLAVEKSVVAPVPAPVAAPVVQQAAPVKQETKPVAQAHMPSEEEVRKLAEKQAKAWAEAEQRSVKDHEERAVRQQQQASHVAKEVPAERARRKPVPWGKVGAGLFVVVLIALFAVPYVLPMQGYATRIEQLFTARLQQPVHIGHMAGRLLPTPRLELSDVSVGESKQITASQVQVNFALSGLFSSAKPISAIELQGMQVNGNALRQVSAWLQTIAADPQYPIARIELNQGKLDADGIQLSGVGGELSFSKAGKFAQAKLHAEGNKFGMDIDATPENKMQVSITVHDSALPLLPSWAFDELSAKGELTSDGLRITELDSRIMGGILQGDARIDWHSGWQAKGNLVAKTITMQNMSKLLGGDMDGTANFKMQASSLSKLTDAAVMDGTFVIRKGIINGMDIVETARLHSRETMPGGRTHFDELSGDLAVANGVYSFRQLKMKAGVLSATGNLDISKQALSGRVAADLAKWAGMGTVALQINGTIDSPALRATH